MIRLGINGGWRLGPRPVLPAGLWLGEESGELLWEMAPDSPSWGEGLSCRSWAPSGLLAQQTGSAPRLGFLPPWPMVMRSERVWGFSPSAD